MMTHPKIEIAKVIPSCSPDTGESDGAIHSTSRLVFPPDSSRSVPFSQTQNTNLIETRLVIFTYNYLHCTTLDKTR
jgi:hypothetical protein